MDERKINRALIAVYDKTGIADFARALVDEFGIEIISTGGTAKHLKDAGIPVTLVEEVTGFPELLDGRVKTLHPKIHAAILADRDNPEHMRQLAEQGIEPIDMVVVNLYPFEKTIADPNCTFEQAIEMIDIGGPCLLRAAAKNHRHVLPVCTAELQELVLGELRDRLEVVPTTRTSLATRVFRAIAEYDSHVEMYLMEQTSEQIGQMLSDAIEEDLTKRSGNFNCLALEQIRELKYGENPRQEASLWYHTPRTGGIDLAAADAGVLGHECSPASMSFNNYVDANAALGLCAELTHARATSASPQHSGERHAAVCLFIKHTNACGVGVAGDPAEAFRRAYLGDPNAAMGGILAVNFEVDADFAALVIETYDRLGKPLKEAGGAHAPGGFFIEVWVAPGFSEEAVNIIRGKVAGRPQKKWGENVRLLAVGDMAAEPDPDELEYKSIAGGMLVQTRDLVGLNEEQWNVVTRRAPSESEISDLRLAWLIAKHTKSNAISICKDGMLIGNGAGQMSRVMSCRIATWLAKENGHADRLAGSVAASDAFFPFRDGPDLLIDAGVTAIIQPGGSKRDEDTIRACDERGVAMIFTGTRHFKH